MNVPWDESIPSLLDGGDVALSTASSVSTQSVLLPVKLMFNHSAFNSSDDSTDNSTNPSITAENNALRKVNDLDSPKDTSSSKQQQQQQQQKLKEKKKKTMFFMKIKTKRGAKHPPKGVQTENAVKVELPPRIPHTLYSADDMGNIECYVLDAHSVLIQEQEKAKNQSPVGLLLADSNGNIECRALDDRSIFSEDLKPSTITDQGEEDQKNIFFTRHISQPLSSSDAAKRMSDCNDEKVTCSFYDQIYSHLMDACKPPSTNVNEPVVCIDQESLEKSKEVVEGLSKEVKGGLQFLDSTLDTIVGHLFPPKEDNNTIKVLSIDRTDTQAEI